MLKKHGNLEQTVEDYAENIRQLGERSRALIEEQHPDRCVRTLHGVFYSDVTTCTCRSSCVVLLL